MTTSNAHKITSYWGRVKERWNNKVAKFLAFVTSNDKAVVAISTICIAVFTAFLVVSNIYLYLSSEKVAEAAKMSAQAALMQASAIRANLSMDAFFEPFNNNGEEITNATMGQISWWDVNPQFKNVGETDARGFTGWFDLEVVHLNRPMTADERIRLPCPPYSPPTLHSDTGGVITPGSYGKLLAKQLTFKQAYDASQPNAESVIFFYGLAKYRDIFGGPHQYQWCDLEFPNDIQKSQFPPF